MIDFLFFVYIKKSHQKKGFLYININNNDSHQQKTSCTFVYVYKAKKTLRYIYIKLNNFQKERKYAIHFMQNNPETLPYVSFIEFFDIVIFHIYRKHYTLLYVIF